MRRHYQQRVRDASYQPGEKVWLHNPRRKKGLSPKLQSHWEGPYTVMKALTDVTYRIVPESGRKKKVVHVDRLAKYVGPAHFTWSEEVTAEEQREEEEMEGHREEGETEEEGGEPLHELEEPVNTARRSHRERRAPRWMSDYVTAECS